MQLPSFRYRSRMRSILLGVAFAAVGCSKPAPPTVVPDQATMTSVDMVAVHLDVTLTATNPNAIDLPVRDVTAKIVVGKKYDLGTATIANAATLPAGKATKLDVPIAVKWTDMSALAQLAATSTAIPFTVDGTVDLGGDLLAVSVPFHLDGTVSHDQLVGAALNSLPGFAR
jgi:LEA14-like dessication related protein